MASWIKKILLNVYALIPLKRELFAAVRFFYIPSERIFRHLYFKGKFKVVIDSEHSFLMQHYGSGFAMESDHFWKGAEACEPYSIQLWKKYALKSDLIFDIGANTGTYSLIAATLNPAACIHAFEPVKRIFTKLVHNNKINQFSINTHNIAMSNVVGDIFICDEKGDNEYTAHVVEKESENTYRVSALRVDYFSDALRSAKQVLFKLDVERHESIVLLGMGELLRTTRPIMLLEILDEESAQSARPFFENLEYVFLNIDESKGYTTIPTIQKSHGNNIFCCPKEKFESQFDLFYN